MAAYAEETTNVQQRQPLADKLLGLLKRVDGDGRELARSIEGLADKLSGTVPSTESSESLSRGRDNMHDLVDLISDRLTGVFADMRINLDRSHRAIGALGADMKTSVRAKPVDEVSRY